MLKQAEPITFGDSEPYMRFQNNFSVDNEYFNTLMDGLAIFFKVIKSNKNSTSNYTYQYKVLYSVKGCKEQVLHCDAYCTLLDDLYDIPYSILISISTKANIVFQDEVIEIPINGMVMFRGDCLHAGGAYDADNFRIFAMFSNKEIIGDLFD